MNSSDAEECDTELESSYLFKHSFLHAEKTKTADLNIQQPLRRRRARSTEGIVGIRNWKDSSFNESHFDISLDQELERSTHCTNGTSSHVDSIIKKQKNQTQRKADNETEYLRNFIVPLDHPLKILWDVITVIISIAHGYLTHISIRDRRFEFSPFISFCQIWFLLDILLNFFSERKTSFGIISDHRKIMFYYLTSWFAVDLLSLLPWEQVYLKPVIEIQNRRGFFRKSLFRSQAFLKISKRIRKWHFRWFRNVAKHSKQPRQRLLRLIIKYVPKYMLFLRNMKAIIVIRILRFVHWSRRSIKNIETSSVDSTKNLSTITSEENNNIFYDWEMDL